VKSFAKDASVMTRRPGSTERIPIFLAHDPFARFDNSTAGGNSSLPGFLTGSCVLLIELPNDLVAGSLHLLHVLDHF
jgi:hypothetical protein